MIVKADDLSKKTRDDDGVLVTHEVQDGTSDIRRQEILLKTGALQDAIINSANFSSIATDENGVIQIFNVGAERMLGYAAADVLNKITPADISDPQELIARALALSAELGTTITPGFDALVFKASRGIEDIYELTYIRKGGRRVPAIVSVTALRDARGLIIGYLLIGTDNTARKQIEADQQKLDQRLRDQQFYTRSLIESNIDAMITTDPAGIITDVNKQMEALTACTRDELIGAPFKNYFTDPDRAEKGIQLVLQHKSVTNYELVARSRDGRETVVSYNASTFYNRDRQLQGVFAAARDVTEQKQASQYARSLIEASLDPLVTINSSGKITDVNEATIKVTGETRETLIGTDFSDYFTDAEKAREGYQQAFAEGSVTDFPLTIRASNKQLTDVLYNASVYKDALGNVLGVFAAARDVTERKRLDQVLQGKNIELVSAIAVAEKASLAKSDFLSSVSHELRSPLNAILGFAQLMETDVPPPTSSQKESIAQILQAGWHLLELINEILDLAKVESGQATMSLEPVSLAEIMEECLGMTEGQAQQREITMDFTDIDTLLFVKADRTKLKQVLVNLISNAIKYNSERGKVEVSCAQSTPGRIRMSISDTGPGLQPEQLAQLFQPFNRLGQENGTVEGTGIGLVVAKRLINLMGGTIEVESTPGVGSVFWFELLAVAEPLHITKTSYIANLMKEQPPRQVRPHTILYVEDNPANLKLVKQIFARQPDFRLLTAVDADLGIQIARAKQPEVILMDINLPGMSGFDALKILRAEPETAHIPVIAVSANAMLADIARGLQGGFFRYITKPIEIGELIEAVDQALELTATDVSKVEI